MSKKMVWLLVGLLLVALVGSTALAGSSKGENWQSIGERLAGSSVTLQELFSALGKPVSGLPSQALDAQVQISPIHKYVIQKKVQKLAQNKRAYGTEQTVQVIFTTWSWIAPWSNTVPTYVDFGAVVEAHAVDGIPVKLMYMSVSAKLTGPGGTIDNAHGSGAFTDEVDASGERSVEEPGSYCSGGHFYYFDFTANPPTGSGYFGPACTYLSQ